MLSGTIPDKVSTSPGLFREMAAVYYSVVQSRFSGGMSATMFNDYVNAISRVGDSQREGFIKYIVGGGDVKPDSYFDGLLGSLPRLGLDPGSNDFNLLAGDSKKDWSNVVKWVENEKY